MTPEQLAEIKARRAAASNEITALTQRIRQWTTSIPVQNTDSDWIFILALESIDALIAENERVETQLSLCSESYDSAAASFYHAKEKHAEFLNKLWEIMGFPYEWEYPGQAERHIEERLKEVVRESGAKMVLPD